ncbi:putative ABC transporter, ATP-binding protein [Desulfonema limicola]|uniref:ABC transporter, ATP-binding protein n=1 Tax=Desulfonema limicola TaxID=45656 RepID=A0A975BDB6_9BACT|nr:ABC transporter ATP-binding protein [Desulfonema limicola]QTA83095.1 putative ABC transporter, ATP-binding protein [Desulfonema limicola]
MTLLVKDIEFSYNSLAILKDIRFKLGPRQLLGVLGVNGAGKSTLLKCLNKILHPKTGSVFLGSRDMLMLNGAEIARHMAYVPQKYGNESLTVFDAVLLGRKPHIRWAASQKDLRIVENILRQMNLEKFSLRPVNTLSGGEMQKVIIARALAQEPEILLLDEPTSSLDLKNQFEVMNIISRVIRQQDLSAVVSIHDLNLAVRFADLFLMIKDNTVYGLVEKKDLTPEMVRDVYGIEVLLGNIKGHTVIVPV